MGIQANQVIGCQYERVTAESGRMTAGALTEVGAPAVLAEVPAKLAVLMGTLDALVAARIPPRSCGRVGMNACHSFLEKERT